MVFDGQSLNNTPSAGVTSYPAQTMAGRSVPWVNAAVSGQSFTTLATTAAIRTDYLVKQADSTVLVLCGGTSDILDGDSAATVASDMAAYASARRSAGVDRVIATTITGNTAFTGPQESVRVAANALILADATYDAVVDLASVPELDDPADVTYYSDGLHWTTAGATAAAGAVGPVLSSVLATI